MPNITANVYAGTNFRGCNSSYVVTMEGVVVIDTPMVPSEAQKYLDEIAKHGTICYVINNEPHGDHISGNCFMGGTLIGSAGTREGILHASRAALEGQLKWMAPDALPLPGEWHFRASEITFTENLTLYLGKHTFHLMSMPGHTPSETAVYVPEEKVVFTSDNVVQGLPILFQAVPEGWLKSIKRLQELDITKVVPGHGQVCDKAYLQVMYDNLEYCFTEVKNAVARGWSLPETQEKVTFAARFPLMPGDPMKPMRHESIAHVYDLMKK